MRRRVLSLLLSQIALLLILQSCTAQPPAATAPPEAQEAAPVTLKIVALPFLSYAPFYIAEEEGFYEEAGLDVEFVNMTQTQEILPALTGGEVDLASSLLSAGMFNAMQRGGQIQVVADKGYIDPNACASYALIAGSALAAKGDVREPEFLRGKTIDVARTTWMQYYAESTLAAAGLSLDDMVVVQNPSPAQPEALTQGTLDLTTNNEPWVTRMEQMGHLSILDPVTEVLPDSQFAVILYGPTLLGENQDVGQRFMAAYLRAVRQYNEGKTDRNVEIVAAFTQLDAELVRSMCWPALQGEGSVNLDSMMAFQEWAIAEGLLEESVPPEQFWNGSFIAYANEQLSDD